MSEVNQGGPAFPSQPLDANGYPDPPSKGMSLRDWFAGMAMQGLVASLTPDQRTEVIGGIVGGKYLSRAAFMYADAMIAERIKEQS